MKLYAFWFTGTLLILAAVILLVNLLAGCAQLLPPTDVQLTNCASFLTAQANAKTIASSQIQADRAQLTANPPTLPADCAGHV